MTQVLREELSVAAAQTSARALDLQRRRERAFHDVIKRINVSRGDVAEVFEYMLEHALDFCEASLGILFTYSEGVYRSVAYSKISDDFRRWLSGRDIIAEPETGLGRIARSRVPLHIDDVRGEKLYQSKNPLRIATADLGGARTFLAVPMLSGEELVGAFTIYRAEVRPFSPEQIEMVEAFAGQAALALTNARLLEQLDGKTREITRSLEALRGAQSRLIQTEKLAALGQLTAGVAHEIKNPLNFINNFADLSAELADELQELLASADPGALDEANEVAKTIKVNLGKVVEHGRRADSIVKNMLLHSRDGSGERRAVDLNAVADESLQLAYHGARAENPSFNARLSTAFDPNIGSVDVYPQELARVLLNLISNALYAVRKRQCGGKDPSFEAEVKLTTQGAPEEVEIRVRDNGTGIPEDVRARMFEPFFTTKPPGEGTGLGLSLSHDIIVKQHGGRIDVDSRVGEFTEFVITLPRQHGADQRSAT